MSAADEPTYEAADGLEVTLDGRVLRLVLNRPDKRNALNDPIMFGLNDALDTANRDERVRAVVISGAGDHFCGGADIVARNDAKRAPELRGAEGPSDEKPARPRVGSIQRRVPSTAHRLIPLVTSVQIPVVCKVQGWAAGIGLHLAAAADFTVAAEDATFWEPFSTRGFTPDSGGTWLVPRRVGETRARDLLLLGRKLTGIEAAQWGLVHEAVPGAELDAATEALVDRLASGPTVSLGFTKWLLREGATTSLAEHLQNEALALELSSRSEDFREGLAAFVQKRDPDFKGR